MYFLGSLGFVTVGSIMLLSGTWFGILPVLFFGWTTVIYIKHIVVTKKLTIGENGITDDTGTVPHLGFIPREDIKSISIDGWFMYLDLNNKENICHIQRLLDISKK